VCAVYTDLPLGGKMTLRTGRPSDGYGPEFVPAGCYQQRT